MYKIFVDDTLFYSPEMDESYGLQSAILSAKASMVDTLKLVVPPTHPLYNLPQIQISEVVVFRNWTCIFAGRIYSVTRDFHNMKTLYVESFLSILNDYIVHGSDDVFVQKAVTSERDGTIVKINDETLTITVGDVFNNAFNEINNLQDTDYIAGKKYNFTLHTTDAFRKSGGYYGIGAAKTAMNYIQDAVTNLSDGRFFYTTYDGFDYLVTGDRETDEITDEIDGVTFKIRGINVIGSDNDVFTPQQVIEFGVNLIDLQETISLDDIYTAVHPTAPVAQHDENNNVIGPMEDWYWSLYNCVSYSKVDPARGNYIPNIAKIKQFGYVVKNVEYTDPVESQNQLYMRVKDDPNAQGCYSFRRQLSVKAIDLSVADDSVEPIQVGRASRIRSAPHGIDETALCQSATIDLMDPTKSSYSFGSTITTMTASNIKAISQINRKTDQLV